MFKPHPQSPFNRQPRCERSPDVIAALDEDYRHLLDRLRDEDLKRIAAWKVEGHDNREIAWRLGTGMRTVERKLGVIRAIWLAEEVV